MSDVIGAAPASAAAVANNFLELGWADRGVPPIDQMKLQKLLFYAHAWHMAYCDRALFDEDFEAWPWGPVVRDVYFETRSFGRAPITKHVTKLVIRPGSTWDAEFQTPKVEDAAVSAFLRSVWDTHRTFSGTQLSNASHAPGEPWTIIKEKYGNLDSKPTIPNDLIRAVFKQKVAHVAAPANPAAIAG